MIERLGEGRKALLRTYAANRVRDYLLGSEAFIEFVDRLVEDAIGYSLEAESHLWEDARDYVLDDVVSEALKAIKE